jgi:integrase/recombinase XerC
VQIKLRQDGNHLRLVDGRGRSVRDANEFLSTLYTRGLSSHTIRAYAYDLKAFLSWFSSRKIHTVEMTDLCKFIDNQRERNLSPRSINRRLTAIELFYRFMTGKDLPATMPSSNYRAVVRNRKLGVHHLPHRNTLRLRLKVPKKLVIPLTSGQVKVLLQQFTRYRDLALCYLMVLCGLRAQEVLNIQCTDLRPFQKTLYVQGKGNKERLMPLPGVILEIIAKYISLERPTDCSTRALFVVLQGRRRGKPMTIAGIRSLFRIRRHHPQLAHIHPHLLRHTFGSTMAASGMSLPTLQRLMGHSFPETTMQYINLSMNDIMEQLHQAAEKISKYYR